ncbi:glycoside hydrolase family protein [Bremerella sp. T1]|uniref:hypothetical protein n=1 Tax=Bremerella sp. TYQ1 TaxID=3119568 RepID=UPI001CC99CB6|nr:hypothetical protein [Bremerella volcania]UBM34051.1 hypothetical protein LA756_15320 [Bremerella volcania]
MMRCAVVLALSLVLATFAPEWIEAGELFVSPNDFQGSDIERINQAIDAAAKTGQRVIVPRINHSSDGAKEVWLLDSAILVKSNTHLVLDNCRLKLSDQARDNIIRSANCGLGITDIAPIENVTIRGLGLAVLEGADRPRATGDSAKTLGERTYGTDAGVKGESQTGDWRNIGILLAHVDRFRVENIEIRDPHCWSISLERCSRGTVRDVSFQMEETRTIDGKTWKVLNQDGLDLRQGCHQIVIENIRGVTGDDLIALTNIVGNVGPGTDHSTMVSGSHRSEDDSDDIRGIFIRNVQGHSQGGHHVVRLLNAGGLKIYDVLIDGLIDTSPPHRPCKATIKIGDANPAWGGVTPLGDTSQILVDHVTSRSRYSILIAGSLKDSILTNIVRWRIAGDVVTYASGKENVQNVLISNVVQQGE